MVIKIGNASLKERNKMFPYLVSMEKWLIIFSKIKQYLVIIVYFGGFYGFLKINKKNGECPIYLFKSKAFRRR